MPDDAEVMVVGGGHNGLICAAYLARSGIDTLLVEARSYVGGCASTVSDLGARFNICNCDHTMIRAMPLIDELELGDHGLHYLEPESGFINLFHDGSDPWIQFDEIERTLDGLAERYPTAVDGYRRYTADAIPVARLVIEMARSPARGPQMLGRAVRQGLRGATRLLDWSRRSMTDVLGRYFDDWQMIVPAASIGPTVWGVPPETPGTGLAAALYATRHLVKSGRPVGGSGALTDAVASSFVAAGGQIRCDARVDRLLVEKGRVSGVRLASGDNLTAKRVVAAYDPQRVFVDWLDETPPRARKLVDRWRAQPVLDGYESKIDAVITGRPIYRSTERLHEIHPGLDLLSATAVISPDLAGLAQAHSRRPLGQVADEPTFLVNVPSVLDPSLQPTSAEHILSLETLFTPYARPGGWPGSTEPQRWIDVYQRFIEPGTLSIDRWRVMTPDRYESEFGMHRGHTPSFSGSPLAALVGRQRETTRYRTPIRGLYLTGAATFPGAGVFGAPGRNAADAILRDMRKGRRRDRQVVR